MVELVGYKKIVSYVKDVEVDGTTLGMYELLMPDYLARVLIDRTGESYEVVGDVEYFNVPDIKWDVVENDSSELRECIIKLIEQFENEDSK